MTDDLNIMFSAINGGYQEFSARIKLKENDATSRIMPDGKVLEPIKVFKEGKYASVTRSGKPIELVVTKERMEKWLANTRRDVPFNEDHNRIAGPNNLGWLRIRSGSSYVAMDPEDGKWALYAQPELTENLYGLVSNGRYRDVSLEIDTADDLIVGIAVTNYPRVKTLTQMSELAPEHDTKAMPTSINVIVDALFSEETFVNKLESVLTKNQVIKDKPKENLMDLEVIKAEFATQLADLKASMEANQDAKNKELEVIKAQAESAQAELEKLRKEKEAAEWQAKRARTILGFSEMVDKMILNDKGETLIPPAVRDDVIELFCHLADSNEVLLFSELEEEKQVTPVALLERVLSNIAKFSDIMSRTVPKGNGAADVEDDKPADDGYGETLRELFRRKHGQK